MAAGGSEPGAEKVFKGVPVDVFLREYDSGRAGDFAPLQCGFASVAGGNALSEAGQWAKLELIARTAERIWGMT